MADEVLTESLNFRIAFSAFVCLIVSFFGVFYYYIHVLSAAGVDVIGIAYLGVEADIDHIAPYIDYLWM